MVFFELIRHDFFVSFVEKHPMHLLRCVRHAAFIAFTALAAWQTLVLVHGHEA
jgi:hypothetical protein